MSAQTVALIELRLDLRKMWGHKSDMRRLGQRWPVRLVSVALTLALVWVSAVGAHAHALGHYHHHGLGAQHDVVVAAHRSPAAHDEGGAPHRGTAEHAGCCDVVCHGGFAIVEIGTSLPVPLMPVGETSLMEPAQGTRPPSLDRPPRLAFGA
jgi:hypothetical protein